MHEPAAPPRGRMPECAARRYSKEPAWSDSGYSVQPIAERWGDSGWKAGVLLSADDARGDRPAKSLSERVFGTREAALSYARSEYGSLGGF